MQAKENALTNAGLADICVSTSAAPTYLPAHRFVTSDGKGKARTFARWLLTIPRVNFSLIMFLLLNLLNYCMQIIDNVGNKRRQEAGDMEPMMSGKRMLVLSLGTGAAKFEEKYNAAKASEWGLLGWVFDNGSTPLIRNFWRCKL